MAEKRLAMSAKFKALFVLPSMGRSGAVDFVLDLCDAMATQQCGVEILVLKGGQRESRLPGKTVRVTTARDDNAHGEEQSSLTRRIRKFPAYLYLLTKLFKAARRNDIVVLTWEMGPALLLPSLVAAAIGKPTIAIVQNNVLQSFDDYRSSGWQRAMRWAYSRAHAVVCVSHDLVEVVRNAGVRNRKLQAIPNAINITRVQALSKEPPPPQLQSGDSYIIGIGRLAPQKGFDLLIKAHARVVKLGTPHRLALVGNGPDKQALESLASQLNVAESVVFLGHLPNPYSALRGSALCCLPSRYDGRALVLSEAAVLGVPIIATDCPTGARETLADGDYGELVDNESVEALAAAIDAHLREPHALLAKAATSARDAQRFSIQTCASNYIELISSCLNLDTSRNRQRLELVSVSTAKHHAAPDPAVSQRLDTSQTQDSGAESEELRRARASDTA